ncbi:MAG TPA: tetratricopeptide repeat protein [Candidatus Angelobacter sp.]|nr:tetratricopeptide repeat protein [Candidatus Angelobacter sp.]
MIRVMVMAIVLTVATTTALAGDAEDCDNAAGLLQTDPARAVSACTDLAEHGDAHAEFMLGAMYNFGQGVLQDYGRAGLWYRKAADQGVAGAQYNLGIMYDTGQGVEQDHAMALQLYRAAAEQGMAAAQYNLALSYAQGLGVPQDRKAAAELYRKAAEQGFAAGQLNLGALYQNGDGVPQDNLQAYVWYTLAAAAFPPGPDHDRATRNRDQVARRMSPDEISRAQRMAAEWRSKSAE